MLVILTIILFIQFGLNYYIFKKNIMSPSVIYSAMFLISSVSALFISNNLLLDISIQTAVVIVFSVALFSIGEYFISIQNRSNSIIIYSEINHNKRIYNIPVFIILTICLLGIYVFIENFNYLYELSVLSGNRYGIEYMLTFAYKGLYAEELLLEKSIFLTQLSVIFRVSVFCLIFATLYNIIFHKNYRIIAKTCLPIAIYMLTLFLATGRTGFIRFIIYVIIVYGILIYFRGGRKKANKRFVTLGIVGILVFIIIYVSYGELRKSTSDMTLILFRYPGQSIFALNNYMHNIKYSDFIGQETLTNVLSTLRTLGFDAPSGKMALEFTYYGDSSTNIYTSLRRYIADYTFLGLFIIQIGLGLFYGMFFYKVIRKYKEVNIIFYGLFIFPVVESIFEERFFITVISIQTLYLLIYVPLINRLVLKNNLKSLN